MYNFAISEVKQLASETTGSTKEAKNALILCEDYDIAKEFISLRHTAVCRYKIVDGDKIRFTENDYIKLARKNVENKQERQEAYEEER